MGTTHLSGLSISPTNVTAATLAVTEWEHAGKTITLNLATGQAVTLPAATGSGDCYSFFIGTTVTSDTTIKVANANDTMAGQAIIDGTTSTMFQTGATSDTITLNGSTTGGLLGTFVELQDVEANVWYVKVLGNGSGGEATPFSATVS
jgi:hypothetical protein